MKKTLVTGASRRVGRGAAIGLAESGFEAFATARTITGPYQHQDHSRIEQQYGCTCQRRDTFLRR
ncbi:MAG: hypothetical protein ACR2IE_01725 [Candidatus Sumerlaeaceae bacterium]